MKKTDQTILTALEKGQMTVLGEYLWGSNYTFSVQVQQEGLCFQGVYKPTRGERPLWDFPSGTLCARETAA